MSIASSISIDRLRSVADDLAKKVSRSRLQECLVHAKLFARENEREELRKIASNADGWCDFVFAKFQVPASRGAAQRALALLAESYVKLPTLDSRVDTAFHKAHQAAERGDITRVQREISKLRDLAEELRFPELINSDLILWMWAGTQSARERLSEYLEPASTQADGADVSHKPEDTTFSLRDIPAEPSTVDSPMHRISHVKVSSTLTRDLLSELHTLTAANPTAGPQNWGLDDSRALIRFPAERVNWLDPRELTDALQRLVQQLHTIEFDATLSVPAMLYAGKKCLDDCAQVLSELSPLFNKTSDALSQIRESVKSALETVCGEDASHALELIQKIDSPSCTAEVLERATVFIAQSHANFVENVEGALNVAKEIQSAASHLDVESCKSTQQEVQCLMASVDVTGLQTLLSRTESRVKEYAAENTVIREAAQTALAVWNDAGNPTLPVHIQEACRAAVNGGDGLLVTSILKHHMAGNVLARARAAAAASLTYDAEINATPIVPDAYRPGTITVELHLDLGTFTPRNRFTATRSVKSGQEMMTLLQKRAIDEMSKNSHLGVLEHALDILLLAGKLEQGGDYWVNVGIVLLSALPPSPPTNSTWGSTLAEAVESALREDTSPKPWIGRLLRQPLFDNAISERFLHKELKPFTKVLAKELLNGARECSALTLEDIFRAVGRGARYGDAEVVREVLVQLANATGLSAPVVQKFRQNLEDIELDAGRAVNVRFADSTECAEGLAAFRTVLRENRELSASRRTRGANPVNIQVPPSVGLSGGFKLAPGSESLDMALLISSPQGRVFSATELNLPASRNVPWLATDVNCTLGPLDPEARLLVPLELQLHPSWSLESPLKLEYELRFIEARTGEAKSFDGRLTVTLHESGIPRIDGYEGASGQPIILTGDKLKLSSASVKDALRDIQNALCTSSRTAALIIGRRRRGKTSILQTIANDAEIRKRYVILADSVEDVPFRSAPEVLGHLGNIFDRLARQLNVSVPSLSEQLTQHAHRGWEVVQEWLEEMNRSLTSSVGVLLLIDEFQKWISLLQPETRTRVLAILRGVMNRPATERLSVSVILSGLSNIRQYTKSSADFVNAFQVYEVKAFDVREADALVRSNETIEFDTRAVIRIRELSGGNPFLINLLVLLGHKNNIL